jgi:hypothetical protein
LEKTGEPAMAISKDVIRARRPKWGRNHLEAKLERDLAVPLTKEEDRLPGVQEGFPDDYFDKRIPAGNRLPKPEPTKP